MPFNVISLFNRLKKGLFLVTLTGAACCAQAASLDLKYSDAKLNTLSSITRDVLNYAKSTVYPFDSRYVVTYRFERTPIGAMLLKPRDLCVILINTNRSAWSLWPNFGDDTRISMEDVFEFAVWHELGHCYNKHVLPTMGAQTNSPGIDSESFSDIFGLAMMRARYPEKNFDALLHGVLKGRDSFEGFFSSGHHTSPAIRTAQAALRELDGDAFLRNQTAFIKKLLELKLLKPIRFPNISDSNTGDRSYNTAP